MDTQDTPTTTLNLPQNIYGLAITASFGLRIAFGGTFQPDDPSAFVRVVLIDNATQQEYLVYQKNYQDLTTEEYNTPTALGVNAVCQETCVLPQVVNSATLRVQARHGQIIVSNISYVDTSISGVDATELRRQQNAVVIEKINEQDLGWIAGETSVSNLTYAEKKRLVNLTDPNQELNLQGFEYYRGGVFELKSKDTTSNVHRGTRQSALVDSFDWRKRHGENWITPVKDQNPCSSCWAFASTGAVEAVTNLYFNQPLNLDLAEQEVLSCGKVGTCKGGNVEGALDYFKTGVVAEAQFPYTATDQQCVNLPNKLVKVSETLPFQPKTEDEVKKMIIENGPITSGISSLWHYMTLVGFQKAPSGRTVWIFKNSWGNNWGGALSSKWGNYWQSGHGENGYAYVILDLDNMYGTSAVVTPIISSSASYQISCEDKDGDGYCKWGISKDKPSTCPASCKLEKDCDDSTADLGPFDANYNCTGKLQPKPPVATFKILPSAKGPAPLTVTLDATESSDSDGSIASYQWSVGEEETAMGEGNSLSHTFEKGQHLITLVVTDSQGLKAVDKKYVTVTGGSSQLPDLGTLAIKTPVDKTVNTFGVNTQGETITTDAVLKGGISVKGGALIKTVTALDQAPEHQADSVIVKGSIQVDSKHEGQPLEIFAYGEYLPEATNCPADLDNPAVSNQVSYYLMERLPNRYKKWDGPRNPTSLTFIGDYGTQTLTRTTPKEFILFGGDGISFDAKGCLSISFGYRSPDGTVIYNHRTATLDNTIQVTVRRK